MPIKRAKSDPQPEAIKISHNGDDAFMDKVLADIKKDWGITQVYLIRNEMMPKQNAMIYDKYDLIIAALIDGKVQYKRTTREERDLAMLQNSGGVPRPVFPEKN